MTNNYPKFDEIPNDKNYQETEHLDHNSINLSQVKHYFL